MMVDFYKVNVNKHEKEGVSYSVERIHRIEQPEKPDSREISFFLGPSYF
jgi:hypothetical protein